MSEPTSRRRLREAERQHLHAAVRYEKARELRNAHIQRALAEGWTHAQIAEATGLTRGRIGQIASGGADRP